MIRILIADDHQIVRAGLSQFIADQPDMRIDAEAESGDEALRLVRIQTFDVVLLDISMPGKSGLDCLRIIRQLHPHLPVLMLSGYAEPSYAVNTLKAGANGYVSKLASPDEIIRAIRIVARGKKYLSEAAVELVSMELARPSPSLLHETLSEREFQIFRKLAEGMTATAIADQLCISVKTVTTYRTRVLQKMGLTSNSDITRYALMHGLID